MKQFKLLIDTQSQATINLRMLAYNNKQIWFEVNGVEDSSVIIQEVQKKTCPMINKKNLNILKGFYSTNLTFYDGLIP